MPRNRAALTGPVLGIWRSRELLRSLTVRNLKVKYQRSSLGFLWTLLNPVLSVAVLSVVFRYIVKVQVPHYVAFLVSGYFVWNFVLQTLNGGSYMLAEHAQLSRSVAFPKEVPVLAAVLSRLVEFGIELALVLTAVAWLHHGHCPASFALIPVLVILQTLLTLGLVLPVAALGVFYRDVQHILPIVLTSLFYVSPVFYPATMVPEQLRHLYLLNPIAQLLTAYQAVIYGGQWPDPQLLVSLTAVTFVSLGAGYAVFSRFKARFAEVL